MEGDTGGRGGLSSLPGLPAEREREDEPVEGFELKSVLDVTAPAFANFCILSLISWPPNPTKALASAVTGGSY